MDNMTLKNALSEMIDSTIECLNLKWKHIGICEQEDLDIELDRILNKYSEALLPMK